jgi:2-methylisocitrate lyase-like PEP mutase family enzyme
MPSKTSLKELMQKEGMVVAPGCYDGLTAKLIRNAGFSCVYMSGGSTSAGFGYPDFGLLTMSEMVENAGRIADAVDPLPVISDADTGYGNELNVYRTVQAFEKAGVSAIHIEDQVSPKRCGHLDDKEMVSREDFAAKMRAAADARRSKDFLIIARTDSRAKHGFEEAIARSNMALEAGADIVFLEAPQTLDEVRNTPKLVKGPCLLNVIRGGKTPDVGFEDARKMGYKVAIVPGIVITTAITAVEQMLGELKSTMVHPIPQKEMPPMGIFERAGAKEWEPLRTRYRA